MTVEKFVGEYIEAGEVDFDTFEKDFLPVSNINDLVHGYSMYFDFDIKRIFH